MKNNFLKYIICAVALIGSLQGCVKESFEGDNIGDKGTTYLKTPDGDEVVLWLSPTEDIRKIKLFSIFKDAHNAQELNNVNTVKLLLSPNIIDEFNEEHETELELLPASYYTWGEDVSASGNTLSLTLGNGQAYGQVAINLNGSKWTDMTKKYALAFVISDKGGITPSETLSDTIIVQLGLKNQWDGVYAVVGTVSDIVSPAIQHPYKPYADLGYGEYMAELHTVGPNKVMYFDASVYGGYYYTIYSGGWSQYGSFLPIFEFDPETNEVISVTNYYGQPASNTRSAQLDPTADNYYDPETKTLKVKYFMLQPSSIPAAPHIRVTITEEYKFVESRQ